MTKLAISATILISGMILPHLKAEECSNAALHGEYSFVASGTLNGTPFATAGQTIYNGDGTADGVIQASLGGTVYPEAPWKATYNITQKVTGAGQIVCALQKTVTIDSYGPLTVSFFGTAGDDFRVFFR